MKRNNSEIKEMLAARCDAGNKKPYYISPGTSMTPLFSFKEKPLSEIQPNMFVHIDGLSTPMSGAYLGFYGDMPNRIDEWVQVSDVYHDNDIHIIETVDGRMFSTENFPNEWNRVLEKRNDMEFSGLFFAAINEKDAFLQTNTLTLLKRMDIDMEQYDISRVPISNENLKNIANRLHSYATCNQLQFNENEPLTKQQMAAIKKEAINALNSIAQKRENEMIQAIMSEAIKKNIPIAFSTNVTPRNEEGMLLGKKELKKTKNVTLHTKERPMESTFDTCKPQERKNVKVIDVIPTLNHGSIYITDQCIISTVSFHDQWVRFLKQNDPERLRDVSGAALDTWLVGTKIESGGYIGALKKAMEEEKSIIEISNIDNNCFLTKGEDGFYHVIDKEDIWPGMIIRIDANMHDVGGPQIWHAWNDDIYVDDCEIVDGVLTLVTPDTVFVEKSLTEEINFIRHEFNMWPKEPYDPYQEEYAEIERTNNDWT